MLLAKYDDEHPNSTVFSEVLCSSGRLRGCIEHVPCLRSDLAFGPMFSSPKDVYQGQRGRGVLAFIDAPDTRPSRRLITRTREDGATAFSLRWAHLVSGWGGGLRQR